MTCARGLGKETRSAVAATMAACRVPLICARSSSPVRDPVEGNQVVLPHLDQQPAGGLLVFGFSLVDDTLADELVVDLPDGHWVVVVLRVIDCGANRVDLGHLATTFPVYRSRPIKGLHDALRSTSVTIDLDPTDDATHGAQQLTFFNKYYDRWCYLPLLAFLTLILATPSGPSMPSRGSTTSWRWRKTRCWCGTPNPA